MQGLVHHCFQHLQLSSNKTGQLLSRPVLYDIIICAPPNIFRATHHILWLILTINSVHSF